MDQNKLNLLFGVVLLGLNLLYIAQNIAATEISPIPINAFVISNVMIDR